MNSFCMEKLRTTLLNPLSGLKSREFKDVENEFSKIAKSLFCNYCIKTDTKIFRFAEIEFYYYKKDLWDQEWNRVTYPRNKDAGELFFHYSGVDICFQTHLDDKGGYLEFGGILIRSLIELDDNGALQHLHAGPQYCANVMLNSCNCKLPQLDVVDEINCEMKSAVRFGIEKNKREHEEKDEFKLCFYIDQFNSSELNWKEASKRNEWDIKEGRFKFVKRNYARERFNMR